MTALSKGQTPGPETRSARSSTQSPGPARAAREAPRTRPRPGLWNFFLPDAETGEGLTNLDYAYIAAELGKNPLASESLNCSAPDTGNMEVLERVGTPEQKEKWLKPLLNGEIRSAYAMTEPNAVVRRQEHRHHRRARRRRVGHQRREVLHLRRRRPALQDHDRHGQDQPRRAAAPQQSQILVPMDTPG
jgi:acyl-CoA dehydrogenase